LKLVFVLLAACGSQQTPTQTQTQTQTPTPSQTPSQTPTPAPTQTIAPTPTPTSTACQTNADCAMSSTRSCCSPCGLPPFADLKSEVDALKSKCAVVECAKREPQECKPTESIDAYHAECQNAACVAVRNPAPPPVAQALLTSTAACTRDADCTVSNFGSCCSSCGSSAYATSTKDLAARNRICSVVDCAMDQRESCPPSVPASLYRAVCRAGTCAGVKR